MKHGCALAEPGGPWSLTFVIGRLENLRFFIQIKCWAPWILQFQTTGLPPIFLRTQPCEGKYAQWQYAVSIPEEEVILSFLFLSSCRSYTNSFSSIMRFNCCGLSWTSANLPTKSCCRYLRNWTRQTGAIQSKLSACLHGGGGTHVGEVTHSSV